METTHASSQIHQTHKTHGDSKVHFLQRQTWLSLNYGEHNPSHVPRYALLSQIISPFRLLLTTFPTRLAAQTQTTYSMLQIKTIPKNISTSTSWTFSFIYPTISEGPLFTFKTERGSNQTHTRTLQPFLAKTTTTNFPSRPNNNNFYIPKNTIITFANNKISTR